MKKQRPSASAGGLFCDARSLFLAQVTSYRSSGLRKLTLANALKGADWLGSHHDDLRRADRRRSWNRLRPHGAQPSGGEPGARNRKLRPTAIEADHDIGRWRHRRMAERAKAVAIKADFSGNNGNGGGLALWADHGNTSEIKVSGQQKLSKRDS